MQTTLETLGQLERRLNVAVPSAQIEGEIEKRLARLAKTVKMPGFRPGKVPMKMVAQQYGPQVRSDVISDAVQSSFNDAMRDAEPARGGLSAHRAEAGRRPTDAVRILGDVRGLSRRSSLATCPTVTIERPVVEVDAGRRRAHARDAAQAARRATSRRRARRRRATA